MWRLLELASDLWKIDGLILILFLDCIYFLAKLLRKFFAFPPFIPFKQVLVRRLMLKIDLLVFCFICEDDVKKLSFWRGQTYWK
jgi:hypothetical protein